MRLNITAMSMASGLLWGVSILIVAAANMIWPSYGQAFLQLCGSIFPGYRPGTGMGSVVTGTIYALVDGVSGGAIFGWLYNLFAARKAEYRRAGGFRAGVDMVESAGPRCEWRLRGHCEMRF